MAKIKPSVRPTETYTEPNFLRVHTFSRPREQVDRLVIVVIGQAVQGINEVITERAPATTPLFALDAVFVGLAGKDLDLIGVLLGQVGIGELGASGNAAREFTGAAGIRDQQHFCLILDGQGFYNGLNVAQL